MNDIPPREAEAVLGSADVEVKALAHGGRLGVTRGVSRFTAGKRSAILKVIGPGRTAAGPDPSSLEPTSYRYWKREPLLFERGLFEPYLDADIRMPHLLARFERPGGDVALWLEDVQGLPGTEWDLELFAVAARRLGRAQGTLATTTAHPRELWLSRNFLPDHLRSWSTVDWSLLETDEAWDTPLVRECFPTGLRREMARLHAERHRFLSWMAAVPRTLCHLDVWPANLFDAGWETVLVDWAFAGDGALGEDPGNLVPDSVFDLFLASASLPDLDRTVFDGYLEGLRDAGWDGDERLPRLGMCASAVKYEWLTSHMLALAGDERHLAYGRQEAAPSEELYRERGATLIFLAGWAEEARRLAAQLRMA